ncbi:hypothetical protein EV363DRAFT_1510619 [Boletus edulis]|nr:hypothetical protein EV363DRAFT_1510619 [Boletus edulis]
MPEKWDIITHKSIDTSYTNLIRLIIINEIHLLHDECGPVLESVVTCAIRRMEQTGDYIQLDVATSLHIDKSKELFYFDASLAIEKEMITQFVQPNSATRKILQEEVGNIKDNNLRDLLPFGFAIHHAGMSREDRILVEELFADGSVQVLVCTAMLAWGVNLPAHTDVLQMLGHAGWPQYDTYGEGIIITNHSELQYYLLLMNQQLLIKLQFMSKLADNLNTEIILGMVRNRDEAVQRLGYTYLYVHMLKSPGLYGVGVDYQEDDNGLVQNVLILCILPWLSLKSVILSSMNALPVDSRAQSLVHMWPTMSTLELFWVFALSNEFKLLPVQQEEKLKLAKLLEHVPIPVKESVNKPAAKINMLLQAYISQLKLEGFALVADMVFVQQSAGHILCAM